MSEHPTPTDEIAALRRELEELDEQARQILQLQRENNLQWISVVTRLRELGEKV